MSVRGACLGCTAAAANGRERVQSTWRIETCEHVAYSILCDNYFTSL